MTLTGTDVTEVNIDLGSVGGSGDAQPDTVIAQGTNGDDVALVFGDPAGVSLLGLAAQVNILNSEATLDRLAVDRRDRLVRRLGTRPVVGAADLGQSRRRLEVVAIRPAPGLAQAGGLFAPLVHDPFERRFGCLGLAGRHGGGL